MQNLPTEILLYIMHYLTKGQPTLQYYYDRGTLQVDLSAFLQTCQRFCSIARPELYRTLYCTVLPGYHSPFFSRRRVDDVLKLIRTPRCAENIRVVVLCDVGEMTYERRWLTRCRGPLTQAMNEIILELSHLSSLQGLWQVSPLN
jgi:hypothetical protein